MEIFIATSIKSFDLNPTHPGPLPRASSHTWPQRAERDKSRAASGRRKKLRARAAADEAAEQPQKKVCGKQEASWPVDIGATCRRQTSPTHRLPPVMPH